MFRAALVALLLIPLGAAAENATARYAPAQLDMARQSLERAREAMVMGEGSLAGELAWQASVDARLAWAMSDSWAVRAPAARIAAEAAQLVRQAVASRTSKPALASGTGR
jgi:hypothetical protein